MSTLSTRTLSFILELRHRDNRGRERRDLVHAPVKSASPEREENTVGQRRRAALLLPHRTNKGMRQPQQSGRSLSSPVLSAPEDAHFGVSTSINKHIFQVKFSAQQSLKSRVLLTRGNYKPASRPGSWTSPRSTTLNGILPFCIVAICPLCF